MYFIIKKDWYVQIDILLFADVFENSRNKDIYIHELDPVHFLSAPGQAWQACLRKTEVKIELLTDNMLLKDEKRIAVGICHAKANNKYKKNYDTKESLFIQYLDANNLYEWATFQKLSVDGFK